MFKTVAYHRAADAIGHAPVGVAQAYLDGHPPDLIGRRQGDRRQGGRAGPDGTPPLSRGPQGGVSGDAARSAGHPGPRATHRATALDDARDRRSRCAPGGGPRRAPQRAARDLVPYRGHHPRRHRRDPREGPSPPAERGARRHPPRDGRAGRGRGRGSRGPGRLVSATTRDHRRPRSARRDHRTRAPRFGASRPSRRSRRC